MRRRRNKKQKRRLKRRRQNPLLLRGKKLYPLKSYPSRGRPLAKFPKKSVSVPPCLRRSNWTSEILG